MLFPAAMRARRSAPLSTAERFRRRLDLVAPRSRTGRYVVVPESSARIARVAFERAQRWRLRLFVLLVWTAATSAGVAMILGGRVWTVHLAVDASLLSYSFLLIEAKRRRQEQAAKVRRITRHRGTQHKRIQCSGVRIHEPVGQDPVRRRA